MKVKGRWHIYEMEMWDKDYFIGIGTPIAERPSHTTGHTGHVSGDSAGQNRHK